MTTQYTGKNFDLADAYLGTKTERPIANNTRMRRIDGGRIAVRLHNTDVIVYRPDGTAELYAGGWQTVTTRERLNRFSPALIWQTKGIWNFYNRNGRMVDVHTGATWPRYETLARFFDGAIVDADGMPLNAPSAAKVAAQEAEEKKLLTRIRKFATAYGQALDAGEIPIPSLGDCLYCQSGTSADGTRGPIGDLNGNTEHLTSHLDETYLVPSLAVNALRAQGRPDMGIALVLGLGGGNSFMHGDGDYFTRTVRQAVTKYLKARLVPTVAR